MDRTASKDAIFRLQTALNRLDSLTQALIERSRPQSSDTVDAQAYRALEQRHALLRTRVEAAIEGIDRLARTAEG